VTDRQSLRVRLDKLREYQQLLEGYRKIPWNIFKEDKTLQGAAQHYFLLAIECCLDIGEIIIADRQFRHPADNRDVFRVLGERTVLPKRIAEQFMLAAGFRNLLVHGYTKIDMAKVHEHLQNDVKQFSDYARRISRYIEKH
jgi:uncharacterized protein YutE (UPF0331/DUF86 family)